MTTARLARVETATLRVVGAVLLASSLVGLVDAATSEFPFLDPRAPGLHAGTGGATAVVLVWAARARTRVRAVVRSFVGVAAYVMLGAVAVGYGFTRFRTGFDQLDFAGYGHLGLAIDLGGGRSTTDGSPAFAFVGTLVFGSLTVLVTTATALWGALVRAATRRGGPHGPSVGWLIVATAPVSAQLIATAVDLDLRPTIFSALAVIWLVRELQRIHRGQVVRT